ncbi:MAG: ATP-binding cassette domain-containing protein [Pseudorhodoplanes sp.]|nr:ATP-binding cassette domain-containing protein [Pseudorhodoplanes sp.]
MPETEQKKTLLAIKNLRKSYGGLHAVRSVSFDIKQGEVIALVGDNGAGKSTLIKMLSGVLAPNEGHIELDGKVLDLRSPSDARAAGIETLHQHLGLVDVFNVPENIFLGRELHRKYLGIIPGLDHGEMQRRTKELFERIDLKFIALDRPVRSMSGGQRQQIAIARLLLNDVRLLIMDEPMAALGVDEGRKVLELICSLRERGVTVFIISHNLEHVFNVADRIAVMKNGGLVGVLETKKADHDQVVRMIVSGRADNKIAA